MVPTASDVLDGVDGLLTLRLMLPIELGGVDASVAEVTTA
jgi:hypothetical protein